MTLKLGQCLATRGAVGLMEQEGVNPLHLLLRHANGDDGDLDAEDKQANKDALVHGGRVFSAYLLPSKHKLWIITEADRSSTTILLPEEY